MLIARGVRQIRKIRSVGVAARRDLAELSTASQMFGQRAATYHGGVVRMVQRSVHSTCLGAPPDPTRWAVRCRAVAPH